MFACTSAGPSVSTTRSTCSPDDAFAVATAPDALPLAPTRLVYFDLETTGLSGGAGMVAFLAGVGEWTPDGFRTTQFLLPSFAAERALLHALNAYLGDDAVLVTYNGRTFDVPVMEVRGEMQRVPQVVCSLPHLDMLHAARRLWRMSEEGDRSCRLTHLEESVLGVGRVGDVGGFESLPGTSSSCAVAMPPCSNRS